jgi:hypothetical protein
MPPGYGFSEEEDNNAPARYSFVGELTDSGNTVARIFRLVPDEPFLVPLIESFTLACLQISSLETATLATGLWETIEDDVETNNFMSKWGIYFAAPGNRSDWYFAAKWEDPSYPEKGLTVPRLTFNTRKWRPNLDLRKMLRGIGGYGEKLDEKYLDL